MDVLPIKSELSTHDIRNIRMFNAMCKFVMSRSFYESAEFGVFSIFSCRIEGFSSRRCSLYLNLWCFLKIESVLLVRTMVHSMILFAFEDTHSFVLWTFKLSQNFKYQQVIFFRFGCKIEYKIVLFCGVKWVDFSNYSCCCCCCCILSVVTIHCEHSESIYWNSTNFVFHIFYLIFQ